MIIGTWQLVDYVMEGEPDDGARPLGDHPLGRLIYGADGHMSVQYMAGDRVIHQVEAAIYPNWIGAKLVRLAVVHGDRLILRAERTPGRPPTPILTWERIH
jgi:hypothetical protein